MGQICCPSHQSTFKVVETEKEISLPSYSSKADKDFIKLEQTYNLLRDISLHDYLLALTGFSMSSATVPEDYTNNRAMTYTKAEPYFTEGLNGDLFQSFIENKILKHPQVYSKAGENETLANIFKANMLSIQKGLISKLEAYRKTLGLESSQEPFNKSHAMAIGLLYCNATNVYRIKFVFNLFAEDAVLSQSEDFKNFLLTLFLIPSYCQLFARNKIGPSFNEIGELPKDRMKEILDACELKDSLNLIEVISKELFVFSEGGINYDQFKNLFERRENSIGWMISSKGIRTYLEQNNI